MEQHKPEELVAVLAHEIGHFKKKHIIQSLVISILQLGVMLLLLSLFVNNQKSAKLWEVIGGQSI
ncbi:M48 family metalloprotease [Echinicola jeungdonensis]|uniref:M48 family metalloprotease n=1 Tax=Echinicola jeungdonensis TaxID=709343 RepID=UPI0025B527A0|nr:M48 family metalloprotease [Echinicola jeungdonensis]MDN3671321.1 M48 family metalloprotease [Echinicola jeungdonensis]